MASVLIRPYQFADTPALVRLNRRARALADAARDGSIWVAAETAASGNEELLGYASAVPVPGLEGVTDLQGFVVPAVRRQGIGSRLLRAVAEERRIVGDRQLSHGLRSLKDPAALFLRRHDFFLEHEEWKMVLDPLLSPDEAIDLQTFDRREAIGHFRNLYEDSFGGTPWYQPYTSDAEVSLELEAASDLLFLIQESKPAGFVWLRVRPDLTVTIEPLGIARQFQGQGLGRALLRAALRAAAERGARRAQLGVWRANGAARRLYRSAGFRRAGRRYYLALDLT